MTRSWFPRVFTALVLGWLLILLRPAFPGYAADNLRTSQVCASGQANITFTWDSAPVSVTSTWIDLSLADNGWQAGTFISAGPIDGAATSYTWSGLASAKTHVVRVNQQVSDGTWYPSPTYTFTTMNCTPAGSSNTQVATNPGADFTVLGFTDHITPGVTTLPSDISAPGGTIQSCPTMIYIWVEGPSRVLCPASCPAGPCVGR